MAFIDNLRNKFDSKRTFKFSELDPFQDVGAWIPSGSPSLDLFLNTLGYPTGIIEVRGASQSGKTTISLQAMKTAIDTQGERSVVTILSSERRDNLAYAVQMGLDVDRIIVHRIKTIEDVKNKIFQTIRKTETSFDEYLTEEAKEAKIKRDDISDYIKKRKEEQGKFHFFFIWDALGQTVSAQELKKSEENAEKDEVGMAALASASRALPNALRSIKALEDECNITLMIINRAYDKVEGTPGKKSYGGNAIELFPTIRLELSRVQGVKVGEDEVGQISEVKIIKSDFTSPKQTYQIEIGYGLGIVLSKQDIEFGIEQNILEKHGVGGALYKIGKKELKWSNRRQLYDLYQKKDPMLKALLRVLNKRAHTLVIQRREEKLKG